MWFKVFFSFFILFICLFHLDSKNSTNKFIVKALNIAAIAILLLCGCSLWVDKVTHIHVISIIVLIICFLSLLMEFPASIIKDYTKASIISLLFIVSPFVVLFINDGSSLLLSISAGVGILTIIIDFFAIVWGLMMGFVEFFKRPAKHWKRPRILQNLEIMGHFRLIQLF